MPLSDAFLRGPRAGFGPGYSAITAATRPGVVATAEPELDFGIRRLAPGEACAESHPRESAWVLLDGAAVLEFDGRTVAVSRRSLFDEPPTVWHGGPGSPVTVRAGSNGAEWAVVRTANVRSFGARLYLPADLRPEYRGAGLVQNACLRNVRLIFDATTRPESNLVLGEVVNYPGRWSSYPPHHHDQPEIYHYRFTHPDGYGHAELGDDVVKVREFDTVVIPPGLDHAQVSAPGYGMYYLWMIRHLPGNPYTGFTFAPEHRWTLDPARQGWRPSDLPPDLA